MINEPTAVLLNFRHEFDKNRNIVSCLVVRLGSYQTDVSLLLIEDGIYELLESVPHKCVSL